MFARACEDHKLTSSQQKQTAPAVQKTLDFRGGVKRKAFDVIEEANKRVVKDVTPARGTGLIAALTNTDSFLETDGQVMVDGEVFDEADFDDIGMSDWETPLKLIPHAKEITPVEKKSVVAAVEEDYFKDDDLDWDVPLGTVRSSPPVPLVPSEALALSTTQTAAPPPVSLPQEVVQNKENTSPPPSAPVVTEQSLAKLIFPSSAPVPWSSSPAIQPQAAPPPKRTLPWVTNPNRYGEPKIQSSDFKGQKSKIKSIVREEKSRGISTMAMEHSSIDWDILGITEKDVFERQKRERMEELERKNEVARRGTEWIDQAPAKTAVIAPRRHSKKTEEKPKGEQKKLVNERKSIAKIFLSQEQLSVRKLVVEDKRSVFFTGSAGTGKSVLLREIISALKKIHERNPEAVAVTASTGLAACNVGGITLHSFAAIGLGKEEVPDLAKKIKRNKKGLDRWKRTKVLIIDEISMVDASLFDKLEALARTLRRDERPFGGIQLVITGDFFQLPPVPDYGREAKFTFEAESWNRSIGHTIKLSSVFRQKDQEFVTMLNEMRSGILSQDSIMKFKALQRPPQFDDNIEPTELFPTRKEVDVANETRMRALPGSIHSFSAEEGGAVTNLPIRDKLLQNCMAPQVLELKKDVQVMLIKNMDENLVNGSLGKVIGFMSEITYSLCEREGIDVDEAMSFDAKALSGGDDPYGFKTLADEDDDSESIMRKKRKILKLRAMSAETSQLWPLVRFTTAAGLHIDRLVTREKWSFEAPDGEVQAYRRQIPLILAYAISIHKAQGQTLSRVRVDLGKVFEKGQAYVALSRATSREGLQILRFDARKVMAHPKVAGFYRSLENIDNVVKKQAETNKGWEIRALEELWEREEEDYGLMSSYAYG